MKPRNRSLSGALIAVVALPVFLGLVACLPGFPVPIGDPEKSHIDPAISGMWVAGGEDELSVWWFVPYDKRSWLMTWYVIEVDEDNCEPDALPADTDFSSYQAIIEYAGEAGDECLVGSPVLAWKAWLTRLGGKLFLTLENKTYYTPHDPTEDDWWLVYGIELSNPDVIRFTEVNADAEVFADLDEDEATRRQYEKILKKQAKNPAIFSGEGVEMFRVQDADIETLGGIALEGFEL